MPLVDQCTIDSAGEPAVRRHPMPELVDQRLALLHPKPSAARRRAQFERLRRRTRRHLKGPVEVGLSKFFPVGLRALGRALERQFPLEPIKLRLPPALVISLNCGFSLVQQLERLCLLSVSSVYVRKQCLVIGTEDPRPHLLVACEGLAHLSDALRNLIAGGQRPAAQNRTRQQPEYEVMLARDRDGCFCVLLGRPGCRPATDRPRRSKSRAAAKLCEIIDRSAQRHCLFGLPPGPVWVSKEPQRKGRLGAAHYAGILPVGERRRGMPFRIMDGDRILELAQRIGMLSERRKRNSLGMMGQHEQIRVDFH